MSQRNTVLEREVFRECQQLVKIGCPPSIESVSQRIFRLGSPDEVRAALSRWRANWGIGESS